MISLASELPLSQMNGAIHTSHSCSRQELCLPLIFRPHSDLHQLQVRPRGLSGFPVPPLHPQICLSAVTASCLWGLRSFPWGLRSGCVPRSCHLLPLLHCVRCGMRSPVTAGHTRQHTQGSEVVEDGWRRASQRCSVDHEGGRRDGPTQA